MLVLSCPCNFTRSSWPTTTSLFWKHSSAAYFKGDALRAFGEAFKKTHKPTGLTSKISDYEAHIGTTNAWATYTQESFDASGKLVNKSREMRILERLNGWKIVAMSNVEM